MLPSDPRETSRAEIARLLCDALREIDEEVEAAKLAAKASREHVAELRVRAKGVREYLLGRGSQAPLPFDTSPTRIRGEVPDA